MLTLLLALQAAAPAATPKSPGEIVAEAPAADWVDMKPDDLLVMQLAPDRDGKPRRVVIQLMPPPFSQPWIANIRTLAKAHWWDGTSVNRVQDNYVAQWGDATEKKALPAGLQPTSEKDYVTSPAAIGEADQQHIELKKGESASDALLAVQKRASELEAATQISIQATRTDTAPKGWHQRDAYAAWTETYKAWPLASDMSVLWPVHCYGMVGVGRDLSPNAGNGTELYVVIGHAPRHLDRNIALVGRVIEGIENLSSLPRGTGNLGFYEKPEQRVPIVSIRMASDLPVAEQPRLQYLSSDSATYHRYVAARANRKDAFFIVAAGGADICNVPVPVRRKP
ncbi:MAG: peptidylprolyl isomerase [Proteobacteria bacterium]|nr:peptidylprolyl isomerase [Pseudomonadota bacterium]